MRTGILILIIGIAFFSCQTRKKEFSINGSISGLDTGKIYLQKIVDGETKTIDTSDIVAGKFAFKGKMPIPDYRLLRLDERDYITEFFLENADINIVTQKDSLRKCIITGSSSQDIYKIYADELEKLQKEVSILRAKHKSALAAKNTAEADKAKIEYQALLDKNVVFLKNFVKEHPKSAVSAYICEQQLASQLNEKELEEIVKNFPSSLDSSEYVIKLKTRLEDQKRIAVGMEGPDFTLNDPDGKPIQLSSLRGKVVLIHFWASWAMQCRQENPILVELYQQYQSKGLEIIGVSLDRTQEKWVKAIQDDKLTWLNVTDLKFWQNQAARLYAITVIPQSVLIDKDGKIIAKGLKTEELGKKLAEIFPN